ncbi:MAG TPA: pilus assembly protein TadG-related protein [Acidimicrobiia bacterium]
MRRARDEGGFVIVFFAILMVGMLGVAAVVVDLGQQRASRRVAQEIADLAATGAGKSLSQGSPGQACTDAITYINMNVKDLSPKIAASSFCTGQSANDVTATNCSVTGGTAQARPSTTVGRYTVTVLYPVLDSDIADSHYSGTGKRDGTPCQRMGVRISVTDRAYFARVFGTSTLQTSSLAVVKMSSSIGNRIPALWLLDPYGCTDLSISGGAQLTLGDASASPPIPGVATIDSDGTACSSNQSTLTSTGSGTFLNAVPLTGLNPGLISLYALPQGATTCTGTACDPADVNGGRIAPQPTPAPKRATRSPVDWRYNCKRGPNAFSPAYPAFHGVTLADCPADSNLPPYIDQLIAAVGTSGQPVSPSFTQWSTSQNCNVPTGTIVVNGDSWVDCNTLSIGAGTNLTFNGNVVFDGTVKMTGGSLSFNTGTTTSSLPSACQAAISPTCLASFSQNAAFTYFRNGDLNITGGALNFHRTFVYQKGGAVKDTGGSSPTWTPPTEGPFAGLSLWSEASAAYTINGGGGLDLNGVFFTPEANPFKVTGGGGVNQQHAQFISYHLDISGSGTLNLAPDLINPVIIPPTGGTLIR